MFEFGNNDFKPIIGARLIQEEAAREEEAAAQAKKKEEGAIVNEQESIKIPEALPVVQPTEKAKPEA